MTGPAGPIARECVEGYLFAAPPLELLIFRRPPARGAFWVPVSGKVEPTDRSFEEALLREIREETGIVPPGRAVPLDWEVPFTADNGETWRLHAYAVRIPRSARPVLSDEHDACDWVDPLEAVRRLHFVDNREAVVRLTARFGATPPTV